MRLSEDQLKYEKDGWRRIVEFIQLESSYCKSRLAEVIRNKEADPAFLDEAEFYQNYYIQQDVHLSMLKHDLNNFERQIEHNNFDDGLSFVPIQKTRDRLKSEVEKLAIDFREMRLKFNNFVEANT
jgi:hypothetical protein